MSYQLGIDVGGTFTDLVLFDRATGHMNLAKTLTTSSDPSIAVLEGARGLLASAGLPPSDVEHVIHGTTLVGNSVIERRGARTALITTAGFKDVLTLGREFRYDIYDSDLRFPSPLVRRRDRFEVEERITAAGDVLVALSEVEVDRVVGAVARGGYEAVAICLLHSYRDGRHERQIADALRLVSPELHISLSSEILPQIGEFERVTATCMNAYVQPLTRAYLDRLAVGLGKQDLPANFFCMGSNGGLLTASVAARYPIRLAESGPVAGALGASWYGSAARTPNLLSFDMGGTTAKACVIAGGLPSIASEFEIAREHRQAQGSGLRVKLPAVDMLEIGAGGGSIARVNDLGLLSVGPESAGAEPGPACYGKGGTSPTVTDADLVLGYLNPDYFLGGEMRLDLAAARKAVSNVAARGGLTVERAASGIAEIVCQDMANALRTHSIEKGIDYRKFTLLAFGGAGPVHAHRVASLLGIRRVLFPSGAGVFSAFGLLTAPLQFDIVRTLPRRLNDLTVAEVSRVFGQLEAELLTVLGDAGVKPELVTISRSVDVRYVGQGVELATALPRPLRGISEIEEGFVSKYAERYGWTLRGAALEVVNWTCVAAGPAPSTAMPSAQHGSSRPRAVLPRKVYLSERDGYRECQVYDRYALGQGQQIEGPSIVEERESTVWIGPGATGTVDSHGSIFMEIRTQ